MTDNTSSVSVVPVTIIRPSRGWISLNLRDLWEYRELLYFLTWRDVKVRYKQTVLGAAWAIIEWKMENGEWRMESIFPFPPSIFRFMMLYFGIVPTWNIVWLPLLLLLALVTSLGVGLWLTAMKCDFACSFATCVMRCPSWCRPGCLPRPSLIPVVCSMSRGALCTASIPWLA